jgi:uroporphyrinogen decarboxylase
MSQSPKPLLKALRGDAVEPPPIWLMRQAGRYLPEYRALRAKTADFLSLCLNPDLACEVTLQPIRRFGFDGAILFADILLVPSALGVPLRFEEGQGPVLDPVRSEQEVMALKPADEVLRALQPVYETVRRLSHEMKQTTLIGFAGAPWTVATYVVEGQGSSDQAEAKLWALRAPEGFAKLITLLTEATSTYLIAQAEAGAEVLQIFESWAAGLSEPMFRRWCIEPTAQIVASVKARFPEVPIIGFPRGCGSLLEDYVSATGIDAVSLDTSQSLARARRVTQGRVALQGNLDPLVLITGGKTLEDEVHRIRHELKGVPHVFNLGHGILPQTPVEHVAHLVELVRQRQT